MGLHYSVIQPTAVLGTKSSAFALSPVSLTADYADNRKILDAVMDTLKVAREMHPGKKNSLGAVKTAQDIDLYGIGIRHNF